MHKRLWTVLLLACGAQAREVTVRILATTDLHGNIYPYDYYAARSAPRGFAKIATLIATERAANPDSMLIDCGDTIQGAPLEGVYQEFIRIGKFPLGIKPAGRLESDPMMLAMNALGYDSMTVGNHEWNFGLKNLNKARSEAKFPWISASFEVTPGAAVKPFAPWIVKTIAGVKIAIVGITTPSEPVWEKPDHIAGYRFLAGKEAALKAVAEVRRKEHPDVVIVAAHAGLEKDVRNGAILNADAPVQALPGENMIYGIATGVPGVDAIVFGHTHSELAGARIGEVLLMQPRNWGMSLGEMDFKLEDTQAGHWRIASKTSRVIKVTEQTPVDEKILDIGKPYHETAEIYLNSPVTESPVAMSASTARVEDSPLIDMVHEVQMHYAAADVSFASIFNAGLRIAKGPLTVRQIAGLYIYDNTLYAIEGTGKMVREALEQAARYFNTCAGECNTGPLVNSNIIGYNADQAAGVDYEIDLRQPVGSRIRNLRYRGQPLADDQKLRIAVNNYRAGGGGGYAMFPEGKIVWRSNDEMRDMMIEYFTEHKTIPTKAAGNWKIVPEAAAQEVVREARRETPAVK
jgi:2',3'-cyclic-nucleotide 2'-phosphodiesterase / 3'-nucleotidase